jgi:D-xylonolactonase
MTMDAEGCVWSARWGGSCLVRYSPDGTELQRIAFPARKVSSAIFGGPDLTDLYVTTAGGDQKDVDGPGAGALFRVRPGVKGLREFRSRIGL